MIPILFPPEEQAFTTMGLGPLKEAISCRAQEERNGIYELEMEYPVSGIRYPDIQKRCIIYAIPSPYRAAQPFRIYKITKPMDGIITVYAAHISYDLNGIPVNPFTASGIQAAMQGLKDNSAIANPFSFYSDKSTTGTFSVSVPTSCRSCLGGIEGSVLDTFRGEFLWDKFCVWLFNQRGQDSGVTIRYRKNLTDLEQEEDVEDLVTGIYPYWADQEGTLVTCNPPIVNAEGDFGFQRIKTVDFSSNFREQPTPKQLQQAAESYIRNNDIGKPKVSLKVDFVLLSQMSGYENLEILEKCDLCDTVTVQYEALGVDVTAEVVKIETNVLTERYESIEVGSIRANIAQQIADQQKEIQEKPSSTQMQNAINHTTQMITGNLGGYIMFRLNEIGQPYEMLIMDTTDIATAQNIWRYNQSGWGHSSNGYNGPYTLGATMDGAFNAAIITVGTMLFDRMKGGLLNLGGAGNGNGRLEIKDSTDVLIGYIDNTGVNFEKGILKGTGVYSYGGSDDQEDAALMNGALWFYYDVGGTKRGMSYINPQKRGEESGTWNTSLLLRSDYFNFVTSAPSGKILELAPTYAKINGALQVFGNFTVFGTKRRAVKTKNHGNRLQYCYETATPYFGDVGKGVLNENGECYVFIDDIFWETVEENVEYAVFLQEEGAGKAWVFSKQTDFFVVKGDPGTKFFWEIKAMQKGYSQRRLDDFELQSRFEVQQDTSAELKENIILDEYDSEIKNIEESYEKIIKKYDKEEEEMFG